MYIFGMWAFTRLSLTALCVAHVGILPVLAMRLQTTRTTFPARDFYFQSNWSLPEQFRPSYQILSKIGGFVYIGGNETLMRLSVDSSGTVEAKTNTDLPTQEPGGSQLSCELKNPDDYEIVCWNFIRVAERRSSSVDGYDILVCGTNAVSQRCYECQTVRDCRELSATKLDFVPEKPETDPVTYLSGNILYGGNVDGGTFERYMVADDDTITEQLDTVTVGLAFINSPTFVGRPFPYTDSSGNEYIFAFYREVALEYSSHGKREYPRIARICQNDPGGTSNTLKFVTFIKARLNCSIPDTLFPFYYDEIQDVVWDTRGADPIAYAVFTSQSLGPKASALCSFRMEDIMNLFDNGQFKEQEGNDVNKQWLPVTPTPNPRPGTCGVAHSTSYPPLLDKLVPNYNPDEDTGGFQETPPNNFPKSDPPILYVDGVRFTSLAVDFDSDCVYYFGTESGTVIKAYKEDCTNSSEEFKSFEINEMGTSGFPVNGLEMLSNGAVKFLVVTTDENVYTWPLNTKCSARCKAECAYRYPYCQWSEPEMRCKCTSNVACEEESTANTLLIQPAVERVTACDYRDIYLYCQADTGPCSDTAVTLSWAKADNATFVKESNHLVKKIALSNHLLELRVTVHGESEGVFNCTANIGSMQVTKQIEVVQQRCLTERSLQERCDEYEELKEKHPRQNTDGTCSVDVDDCDTCRVGYNPLQ